MNALLDEIPLLVHNVSPFSDELEDSAFTLKEAEECICRREVHLEGYVASIGKTTYAGKPTASSYVRHEVVPTFHNICLKQREVAMCWWFDEEGAMLITVTGIIRLLRPLN